MPWMACGPGWPPESTGEAAGSTAKIVMFLNFFLSTSPTPVIVPPVPTPATKASIFFAPMKFMISFAVVLRCTAGFAGLPNWSGLKYSLPEATISSPFCNGALHALVRGREHEFRAVGLEQPAPLHGSWTRAWSG